MLFISFTILSKHKNKKISNDNKKSISFKSYQNNFWINYGRTIPLSNFIKFISK